MAKGQEFEVEQVGTFSPEAHGSTSSASARSASCSRHQDRQRRADWRHHHRGGTSDGRGLSRIQGQQAHGLRRALSGRGQRVRAAARGAREAAPERRLVLLRAGNVGGARLRLPLRLSRPAPHGDRPGAARARVQSGPGHDGAGRSVPGDDDRWGGAGDRQSGEAARHRPHREVRGAGHHGDDSHAVRARRRHPLALPGQARHPEGHRIPVVGPRARHLRAAVQRSGARLLRPPEDHVARLRLARLSRDRLLGVAARQARHPGERGARRRALDHRAPRFRLHARPRAGGEDARAHPPADVRGGDSGGRRQPHHRARIGESPAQERAGEVLRRRHQPQAQAARETEGRQEAHEARRPRRDPAGSLPGSTEEWGRSDAGHRFGSRPSANTSSRS